MLVSRALGGSSRTCIVLNTSVYGCRLWLNALLGELGFDGASEAGLVLLDYPSRTMLLA